MEFAQGIGIQFGIGESAVKKTIQPTSSGTKTICGENSRGMGGSAICILRMEQVELLIRGAVGCA